MLGTQPGSKTDFPFMKNPLPNDIILGSASPRRSEILSYFNIPFRQLASNFDEALIPQTLPPDQYALEIAKGKLLSLIPLAGKAMIITADTTVYKDGIYYGKPKDEAEAALFLKSLQGDWHTVISAICLYYEGKIVSGHEETKVLFNAIKEDDIESYIRRIHWKDKAGGYGIQESGALLVQRIEGCFYNVMGFPINMLRHLLNNFGINLWHFL